MSCLGKVEEVDYMITYIPTSEEIIDLNRYKNCKMLFNHNDSNY